jgi:hypothetical protein
MRNLQRRLKKLETYRRVKEPLLVVRYVDGASDRSDPPRRNAATDLSNSVSAEGLRGLVIAKIAVARGDAPLYMMGGTIYIRRGSSDVQAQPEDAVRLVAQYAF